MNKILILLFLLSATGTYGQKSKLADSLLTMLSGQEQFNGNVLIVDKGQTILKKSYGTANISTKAPLNENTVFELASVSKQFTAAGIMLLKEKKRLDYSDKISTYIPELSKYGNITIRQLLDHSSGLPDYMELMQQHWDHKRIATNEDVIRLLQKSGDTLSFQPGTKFEYSNTGYMLLGTIIERVSRQSFGDFMSTHIFKPLDMQRSFVYRRRYQPEKIANYASGYVHDDERGWLLPDSVPELQYVVYLDGIVGDGMVNSTVNDLFKWYKALQTHTLISQSAFDAILHPPPYPDGKPSGYAFGWMVADDSVRTLLTHTGSWAGYLTCIEMDLKNDYFFVILQNYADGVLPTRSFREILRNLPLTRAYARQVPLTPELLKKHTGAYKDLEDSTLTHRISAHSGHLVYNSTNQPWDMAFYPETANEFFFKNNRLNVRIEFSKEPDGKRKMHLFQNNKKIGEAISSETLLYPKK